MSDWTELKKWAEDKASGPYDYGTGQQVLSLIAENERLRESDQESTELCDTLSALLGQIAVAVRGPEEPKSRHGFHDLPSRVKTVVAERDQLKAEKEALRRAMHELANLPDLTIRQAEVLRLAMGNGEQP